MRRSRPSSATFVLCRIIWIKHSLREKLTPQSTLKLAKLQSTADSQNGQSLREARSDLVGWEELLTRLLRIQPEVEKMPDVRMRVIPTLSSKLSSTEVELKKAKATAKTVSCPLFCTLQQIPRVS